MLECRGDPLDLLRREAETPRDLTPCGRSLGHGPGDDAGPALIEPEELGGLQGKIQRGGEVFVQGQRRGQDPWLDVRRHGVQVVDR